MALSAAALSGVSYSVPTHHDLVRLRADLLSLVDTAIAEIGGLGKPERRKELQARLKALPEVDPRSMVFRYPEDGRRAPRCARRQLRGTELGEIANRGDT
jgi:hypothetical protein